MLTLETRKSYYEVLTILKHMDRKYYSLISPQLLRFLKDNCVKDFDFHYNPKISLRKQNISQHALALLGLLDLLYWAKRR